MSAAEARPTTRRSPTPRYKAALRAFPNLVPDGDDAPGAAISRARASFWRDDWAARASWPSACRTRCSARRRCARCSHHPRLPAPMEVAEGGHFVQEWGAPIARAALQRSGWRMKAPTARRLPERRLLRALRQPFMVGREVLDAGGRRADGRVEHDAGAERPRTSCSSAGFAHGGVVSDWPTRSPMGALRRAAGVTRSPMGYVLTGDQRALMRRPKQVAARPSQVASRCAVVRRRDDACAMAQGRRAA